MTNETIRLRRLHELAVLDTAPEQSYDELTELAALMLGAPMAVLSFIDEDRQWFKARFGLELSETPRNIAFCDHAINTESGLVVEDAEKDPRFSSNPMVMGAPHLRAYAGMPVVLATGERVGALAVLDNRRRTFDAVQIEMLTKLARQVARLLDLKLLEQQHRLTAARLEEAQQVAQIGSWDVDIGRSTFCWTPQVFKIFGLDESDFQPTYERFLELVHPQDRTRLLEAQNEALAGKCDLDIVHRITLPDGTVKHVRERARLDVGDGTNRAVLTGTVQDVTEETLAALRNADTTAALSHTSELLSLASSMGKLGAWSLDLAQQQLEWSDEVARIHGMPPDFQPATAEEAIGFYWHEDRPSLVAAIEACKTTGLPMSLELRLGREEGALRWVKVVGMAVRNDNQTIVALRGAIQDIDESKRHTTQLAEALQRSEQLADAMPVIVWTAQPDGTPDYVSQSFKQYADLSSMALAAGGWSAAVHPDDLQQAASLWQHAVQTGEEYLAELRLRTASDQYRWHLARAVPSHGPDGKVIKWYGSLSDIQEQKLLAEKIHDLASSLGEIMESTGDAIFSLRPDWCFEYVNTNAERLLSRSRHDLIGQNIWSVFPEAVGSRFQTAYEKAMNENQTIRFEEHFTPLRKTFEVNATSSSRGLTVYFRDVTEQRALQRIAQQTQRLEALGQLTGGIAHDFNNLLTVILGNAEVLEERSEKGGLDNRLAAMVSSAALKGSKLTQRLLAFARKQPLQPKAVDLNGLIGGMDELLRRTLGEDIQIEIVRHAGLWTTLVDPSQLEDAILNLALNARDAMPTGGKLTLEASNIRLDEDYVIPHQELPAGQYVCLMVSDSGSGIEAADLPHVFEPFFTRKKQGEGTGLGLAMVYGFAKQSRGHVAIYSEVSRGTTVKVYLPRLAGLQTAESVVADQGPGIATPGAGELILVVEDEPLVREYARSQLLALGFRVMVASDGHEGLRLLRDNRDIALLFTDVVMPGGMSGRELAEQARLHRPELPVLFTSGYSENAIVHNGRLDAGVLLLSKPYRRADLVRKVLQALDSRAAPMLQES